jgi:hypothetical protein
MKLKYFNVLTENSNQKTQIQELMKSKLESQICLKEMNEEKHSYTNELYLVRMDLTKRLDEVSKKSQQIGTLQEEVTHAHKKIADLIKKDTEIAQLQNDIEQ